MTAWSSTVYMHVAVSRLLIGRVLPAGMYSKPRHWVPGQLAERQGKTAKLNRFARFECQRNRDLAVEVDVEVPGGKMRDRSGVPSRPHDVPRTSLS